MKLTKTKPNQKIRGRKVGEKNSFLAPRKKNFTRITQQLFNTSQTKVAGSFLEINLFFSFWNFYIICRLDNIHSL